MTHRDEALRILEEADRDVSENWLTKTGEEKADMIAQAQVHALLEIGEQMRVANLIALTKCAVEKYGNYAPQGVNLPSLFKPPLTEQGNMLIHPDIAEVLRLDGDPQ